jgi:serine/threonine protein kinase
MNRAAVAQRTSSHAALTELRAPPRLGDYELLDRVGAGGVGVVYRAVHHRTGCVVALKTLRYDSDACRKTISREIELLETHRHPGIIRLEAHSHSDDPPWYAMELLAGVSARGFIGERWPEHFQSPSSGRCLVSSIVSSTTEVSFRRHGLTAVLRIVRELCEPLRYLHERGVVHGDVKPENIFLCDDGRVVLLDFGAARYGDEESNADASACTTFGTWMYMAPECRVGAAMDHRADVYALGCVLQELLTGRPPVLVEPWRRPSATVDSELPQSLPVALRDLVRALTSVDPEARLSSLANVRHYLADIHRTT